MNIQEKTIYLLACAVNDKSPNESIIEISDLKDIYNYAVRHSVASCCSFAVINMDLFKSADESIKKLWLDKKHQTLRQTLMFDAEREEIISELENNGIWYMPLKGTVLKDYYPHDGMREMADNDILFDASRMESVKDIFISLGYSSEYYGVYNHDVYHKEPIYNFEMHRSLFSDSYYPSFAKYYDNIKSKLIKDSDNEYGYHLSDSDFYIYNVLHAYKHYQLAGCGIRMLIDTYIMNRELTIDRDYVTGEFEKLEINEFENTLSSLSEKLFSACEPVDVISLNEAEKELYNLCTASATYGTTDRLYRNRISKVNNGSDKITPATKLKYYLSRLFPNREWCKEFYPTIYEYPVLLPFLWIFRITVRMFLHRKLIKDEISFIQKIK